MTVVEWIVIHYALNSFSLVSRCDLVSFSVCGGRAEDFNQTCSKKELRKQHGHCSQGLL